MRQSQSFIAMFAVAASTVVAGQSQAASIGWKHVNAAANHTAGTPNAVLAPGDLAGAPGYKQTNWNNHTGAGQGPGATPFALNNDQGALTGVVLSTFTLGINNSWSYQDNGSPDAKLISDFAVTDPVMAFTNIHSFTPDGYTVVVYYGNNEWNVGSNTGTNLTVNGVTEAIETTDEYSVSGYVQDLPGDVNDSNYAIFTNVTGDTLNISFNATQNDGVSAVQIIAAAAVPEPTGIALLGLGGLAALRRRRTAL